MSDEDSPGPVHEDEPLWRRFLAGDAAACRAIERWAADVIRFRFCRIPREEQ